MKRAAGVLFHISSLWGDYSVGSLGAEARQWIDFLAESGFSYWQVLPITLPDEYNSPYKSFSAFSVNPYFIDLPTLRDKGLLTDEELATARQRTPYGCEFDRLKKERLSLLSRAAARFCETEAVGDFLRTHPGTDRFCTFMACRAANRDAPFPARTISEPDAETLRLWRFLVFEFYEEWQALHRYANERGISLIGDVPIYVAADSADVLADPGQFLLRPDGTPAMVAGVPPDYFCADGQLWGNPLYNWNAMKADGFAFWRTRMQFMCELFDGVRIDHFRGLAAYYAIPADAENARNGKWMRGPGMALLRALRDICDEKLIIAEDLGVITPDVTRLVEKSGYPGMRVLQFAMDGDENSPHLPHNYPAHCVAYTGTHDNNTLLGYVWELDDATRRRLFAYCGYEGDDWSRACDAILRTMWQSHADLLIVPVQDLLVYGSDTRLNTPGKPDGNWSYRLTEEQLHLLDRHALAARNALFGRAPKNADPKTKEH